MARKKKVSDAQAAELLESMTRRQAVVPPDYGRALSTGSTLINLALTGRPDAGWVPGTYYHVVGTSDSGKTYLALTAFAEAANAPPEKGYEKYRLIYDNPEQGAQMELSRSFGQRMAERLEPPAWHSTGEPRYSAQAEEFFHYALEAFGKGPCLEVLDSYDALTSAAEEGQAEALGTAVRRRDRKEAKGQDAGIELEGNYGDGKAKVSASLIRQLVNRVYDSKGILVVISQAKEDIKNPYNSRGRFSGGAALRFFSHCQMWSAVGKPLYHERQVDGKKLRYHIGNECHFNVERSRFTGRKASVTVPIYYSAGIDDVGSCIDYMVQQGEWKRKDGGQIRAPDFDCELSREALVEKIEGESLELQLQRAVAEVWDARLSDSAVVRKKRYS